MTDKSTKQEFYKKYLTIEEVEQFLEVFKLEKLNDFITILEDNNLKCVLIEDLIKIFELK